MNRRELLKGATVLPFLTTFGLGENRPNSASDKKIIKPKRLSKGDTVGIIAPASGLSQASFDKAVQNLENLGFKTKVGQFARGNSGIFSGTDKERLSDLHWAFNDSEIKAVWCVRGGDGAPRILPDIDYQLIKRNPKILIGYSDITALHVAIFQNTGLVTFHGPVASSSFTDYSKDHLLNVLMNPTAPYKVELSEYNKSQTTIPYKTEVITTGKARGKLIGGNLSLLTAIAGTPFALKNMKGRLLFIEEVDEAPYRVDRMLTQLRQTLDMHSLAGVALGVFADSKATDVKPSPAVIDVLKDRLGDLGIPVIYGLSFGHIRDQFTLPVGIEAELDTENATMTFLDTGVI